MQRERRECGPTLRPFEVTPEAGGATELLTEFAATSAQEGNGEPGSEGDAFGQEIAVEGQTVLFASVWRDLDAAKGRLGDDWRMSFLPEGHAALIETCSVRHVDLGDGWHVEAAR